MQRRLLAALPAAILSLALFPAFGHAASPPPPTPPSIATFEGHQIDLSKGWGDAHACLVARSAGIVECFSDQASLQARESLLQTQFASSPDVAAATCSTPLRLYADSSYGGRELDFYDRGIQQLVSDLAREMGIPQLYLWGTEGAYGGAVARVIPRETGCWFCLQLAFEDGSIPTPPLEETGRTQPRGCGMPTFTGENYNLMPIVAQAARTAIATLLGTHCTGEDVFVMSLRNGDEAAAAPTWSSYPLRAHPRCPHCASHG